MWEMPKKSSEKATWKETLDIAGSIEHLRAAGWAQKTVDNYKNKKGPVVPSSALSDFLLRWWRGKHKLLMEQRLAQERAELTEERAELTGLIRQFRERLTDWERRAG